MQVELLHKLATFQKGSAFAVGYDLTVCTAELDKEASYPKWVVRFGIKVAPDEGTYFLCVPRSSFPNYGWMMANSIGIIDPDYRGEWMMRLAAIRNQPQVDPLTLVGKRIAQAIPMHILTGDLSIRYAGDLPETVRGEGGFGSTGE